MTTIAFPDLMMDFRYWLRNHPNFADLCAGKVFFRFDDKVQAPFMRIYSPSDGPEVDEEVPMLGTRISVEIWGAVETDYPKLRQIKLGLMDACWRIQSPTLINPTGDTILNNARFGAAVEVPDPDTGRPRIVCDVTVTAHTSASSVV